jgi:hypothetical protein
VRYIYKYELLAAFTYVMVPAGSKILKVMVQHDDQPCVWIEQDSTNINLTNLTFQIIPTGMSFEGLNFRYIDSFTLFGGTFVGHVYVQEN